MTPASEQLHEPATASEIAAVDYLIGQDCILSTLTTHTRGRGPSKEMPHGYLPLHGDDPQPHPGYYASTTVNICLTDVTEDSGCLAFVPGSHKLARQPTPAERVLAGNDANTEAVPVVAPAGAAIVWPSQTWHGSWESPDPGLRVTLAVLYSRPHLQCYEMYRETVPEEALERNSPRSWAWTPTAAGTTTRTTGTSSGATGTAHAIDRASSARAPPRARHVRGSRRVTPATRPASRRVRTDQPPLTSSSKRRCISLGETSSISCPTFHRCPEGSFRTADRSP